jgi:hypothetical protein
LISAYRRTASPRQQRGIAGFISTVKFVGGRHTTPARVYCVDTGFTGAWITPIICASWAPARTLDNSGVVGYLAHGDPVVNGG